MAALRMSVLEAETDMTGLHPNVRLRPKADMREVLKFADSNWN